MDVQKQYSGGTNIRLAELMSKGTIISKHEAAAWAYQTLPFIAADLPSAACAMRSIAPCIVGLTLAVNLDPCGQPSVVNTVQIRRIGVEMAR
jgi:hypothetical protein